MQANTIGLVSPTQSNPGETIEASDINTPVNQLAAVINGNIETANLHDDAVTTSKLVDAGVTTAKVTASGCHLYKSASQTISNNTVTAVTWNSERFDTDSYHSTSVNTSRITVPTAGKYLFIFNLSYAADADGLRFGWFAINGTSAQRYGASGSSVAVGSSLAHLTSSAFLNLSVNDYVEVYTFHSAGNDLAVIGDDSFVGGSGFEVIRLGA